VSTYPLGGAMAVAYALLAAEKYDPDPFSIHRVAKRR